MRLLVILYMNNNNNFDFEPGVKRTYTPEEAGHEKFRRPVTRQHRRRKRSINVGVVLITLVFSVIIGVCAAVILLGNREPISQAGKDSEALSKLEAVVTEPAETEPPEELYITVSEEQMHMGNLILVNYAHPYAFAESEVNEIVTISEYKNENYYVRNDSMQLRKSIVDIFNNMMNDMYEITGFRCLQVNSSYRSYQEQVDTYAYYKDLNGEEYAKTYVANPGYSEHHTGLALDLNSRTDAGGTLPITSNERCNWFIENCEEYGFILRYDAAKKDITKISGESWHYRYVGKPHSLIMKDMNFCLEEYTDYIKSFTVDTFVLTYNNGTVSKVEYSTDFDAEYMIYYVPSAGKETVITVPNFCEYEISGNNVDGFVVTVAKRNG